ncbi:hypothetical protein NE237_017991 [Protea cynaroides]|uniref:DUF4220 domain-containing protein n=1 Tax=Protea cynaroides TaxID=273540 RepID=A0A9Q0K939_9MAGN|nr:hypothetical protein NE237_017991 [Protea cynaroides]
MLNILISSWLLIEKRSEIHQTIPEHLQKLWYDWELPALILLSLVFQILLILLGDRRKHIAGNTIGLIIWVAYLSADSVAILALGVLSKKCVQTHTHTDELRAFWVPFLLLHLGGPDTITAYALEDNELWLRHLAGLVIQASGTFFVIFRSWTGSCISILTILMFVAGVMKYGERILALWSASKERFRKTMLSPPDPGPNYAKFMEGYVSKQDEGFLVDVVRIVEDKLKLKEDQIHSLPHDYSVGENSTQPEILLKAHELFEIFKRLFADLILSYRDGEQSKSFIKQSSAKTAFKVLEIELGFTFDVLYTKVPIVYTLGGGLIRSFCFFLTISVFVIFTTVGNRKHYYSNSDLIITYLLLIVAIILEIYAVIILLSSDWVLLWLSRHKMPSMVDFFVKRLLRKKRWSNSMGQYNLISFCLRDEPSKFTMGLLKLCPVQEMLEIYLYTSFKEIPDKLKEVIFEQLKGKLEGATNNKDAKSLCTSGAKEILNGANLQNLLGWSIGDVEFHQSILLWHIATDLCYALDRQSTLSSTESSSTCAESIRDMCKLLSDYMLHLLIAHPFMLPEGIGQIRFKDTCAEARELFKGKESSDFTKENAREMLLKKNTDIPPIEVKGDRSKSVLFDACRLAKNLKSFSTDLRWEIIATVWVDMLSYAATQCRGPIHAKQLSRGGELLTHIWLLMAHLGMTEQFQISQGQVRAKLIFG